MNEGAEVQRSSRELRVPCASPHLFGKRVGRVCRGGTLPGSGRWGTAAAPRASCFPRHGRPAGTRGRHVPVGCRPEGRTWHRERFPGLPLADPRCGAEVRQRDGFMRVAQLLAEHPGYVFMHTQRSCRIYVCTHTNTRWRACWKMLPINNALRR